MVKGLWGDRTGVLDSSWFILLMTSSVMSCLSSTWCSPISGILQSMTWWKMWPRLGKGLETLKAWYSLSEWVRLSPAEISWGWSWCSSLQLEAFSFAEIEPLSPPPPNLCLEPPSNLYLEQCSVRLKDRLLKAMERGRQQGRVQTQGPEVCRQQEPEHMNASSLILSLGAGSSSLWLFTHKSYLYTHSTH